MKVTCACGCGKPVTVFRGRPRTYRHGHNPIPFPSWEKRFWAKVNKNGPIATARLGRCWQWTGGTKGKGYAEFHFEGRGHSAHRFLWIATRGPIPKGMDVHHKCNNRRCVRLSHLEVLTHAKNVRIGSLRRTTCTKGHPLVAATPYLRSRGLRRFCRKCKTDRNREWRKRAA